MRLLIYTLFSLVSFSSVAQNYSVALIPDSLMENANAVVRFQEMKVIIKSPSKAILKHKWAVTILNEEGFRHSWYHNTYDKLQSLEDISGKLFDAAGKHIRSIKKKEIADLSEDDNISLMTDNRAKQFNFYHRQYPYTVEFEDEQVYHGIFFLPSWMPVTTNRLSVQHSSFTVQYPLQYSLRYKQMAFDQQPVATADKSTQSLTWTLQNFKPVYQEPYQPKDLYVTPVVRLAPSDFEIQGYSGNMNTWEGLGAFILKLNAGKDELPAAIKADIEKITASLQTVEEKVAAVYDYLQKNTRYISIQLGIGGWQPYEANYVASKRYGDCKALSNYMVALLKAAGIKSNYVLVRAGDGRKGLDEDFPAPNFNHAIMCVPNGADTIWLECTSQTQSPGFMGSFTGNRKALLITEEGGVVVNTPHYTSKDNLQTRKVIATIDKDGNLAAEVYTRFIGEQQERQHSLIHAYNDEERQRYLNEEINLPTYTVEESRYTEHRMRLPAVDEFLRITSPAYATVSGKRLFIQPNLFNKNGTKLSTEKPRRYPVAFSMAFLDIDTVQISIPRGYEIEARPKDVSIRNKFGQYQISFEVNADRITVLRTFELHNGTYPPGDYIAIAKFFEEVYKADRAKLVFVKNE